MPNIRQRTNPNGKNVYFLDYYDPFQGKRIRSVVGFRHPDAQKRAAQLYKTMMARYVGEPETLPSEDIRIDAAIVSYLGTKAGRISDSSLVRYRIFAKNFSGFMGKWFPDVQYLRDVKRAHLEEHLQHLRQKGHQPKSINGALQFIKALFRFCAKEYGIANPAIEIKPFPEHQQAKTVAFWTIDEVNTILDALKPHWRDIFEFLYCTGLRKNELINLTWSDISLDNPNPSITIQAKDGWNPKTSQRRIIPLNKRAQAILQRQTHSSTHPYVFTGVSRGKIHHDRIYTALKRTLARLGLSGDVHKFRHTFASQLVMQSAGIEAVSKLLGHSSIEMTMIYAHLSPDHLRRAVEKLPDTTPSVSAEKPRKNPK